MTEDNVAPSGGVLSNAADGGGVEISLPWVIVAVIRTLSGVTADGGIENDADVSATTNGGFAIIGTVSIGAESTEAAAATAACGLLKGSGATALAAGCVTADGATAVAEVESAPIPCAAPDALGAFWEALAAD